MMWRNRLVPAGMPPATRTPTDGPAHGEAPEPAEQTRVVRGPQAEVTPWMRKVLAEALHTRHHGDHGDHAPGYSMERCAELSGAFDDVAAIEPIILGWLRGAR